MLREQELAEARNCVEEDNVQLRDWAERRRGDAGWSGLESLAIKVDQGCLPITSS